MKGGPLCTWPWHAWWQPAAVSSSVMISESPVHTSPPLFTSPTTEHGFLNCCHRYFNRAHFQQLKKSWCFFRFLYTSEQVEPRQVGVVCLACMLSTAAFLNSPLGAPPITNLDKYSTVLVSKGRRVTTMTSMYLCFVLTMHP